MIETLIWWIKVYTSLLFGYLSNRPQVFHGKLNRMVIKVNKIYFSIFSWLVVASINFHKKFKI